MKERLRPVLAALLALLIGGDLAASGFSGLFDVWRFIFPYLWLFLVFEVLRSRRRLLDTEAFLIGAAVGLLHDGVYAKILQDGAFFLGLNWLGSLCAAFDWGLTAVCALHVADALWPREELERPLGVVELAGLVVPVAMALCGYLINTVFNRYRFERMLGSTWLIADILFAVAAGLLFKRAFSRAFADDIPDREGWIYALTAFCAWLPGAQGLARLSRDESGLFTLCLVVVWGVVVGGAVWRFWRRRGFIEPSPRRASRPILGVAVWRLAGAILLLFFLGPFEVDGRMALAYSLLVEMPSRLVFSWIFLSSRLRV